MVGSGLAAQAQPLGIQKIESDSLQIDLLAQSRGDFILSGDEQASFTIPNLRVGAHGRFQSGFGYNLQIDLADNPVLLDASLRYRVNPQLNFSFGAQKPGISMEYLTGPGELDLINRARIVRYLVAQRDIGLRVHGQLTDFLEYSGGIFNGSGLNGNNNSHLAYAGRIAVNPLVNSDLGTWTVGVNGLYSEDDFTEIGNGFLPLSTSGRSILGAYTRFETEQWWASAEYLWSELQYGFSPNTDQVQGFQATGGYKIDPQWKVVGRYDYVQSDMDLIEYESDITAGVSYNPVPYARLQLEYGLLVNSDWDQSSSTMKFQIQIQL
jgi:hypothetical protein